MPAGTDKMDRSTPFLMSGCWEWIRGVLAGVRVRKAPRRLRLCESLALGEKRFVAVIQFDTQQFLVGGGASSVNLLARLGESPDFAALLTEWCERQR
jgi:flagellar biogenesis protein FliO